MSRVGGRTWCWGPVVSGLGREWYLDYNWFKRVRTEEIRFNCPKNGLERCDIAVVKETVQDGVVLGVWILDFECSDFVSVASPLIAADFDAFHDNGACLNMVPVPYSFTSFTMTTFHLFVGVKDLVHISETVAAPTQCIVSNSRVIDMKHCVGPCLCLPGYG